MCGVGHPYVLLSAAVSLDGHLDDAGPARLLLSNDEDFDRVDALRAESDAILVGAGTIRADNPRLTVRSPQRRAERMARGLPEHPVKVALSGGGELDPGLNFWHHGGAKLVYSTSAGTAKLRPSLAGLAEVVDLGEPGAGVELGAVLHDLAGRGVRRLMVEGGGRVHTAFLAAGLADELVLAVAPVLVGDERAARFLYPADYPAGRLRLVEVRAVGDMALLRYVLSTR
jgi:riboflavin-specific deaminase-like protein